MSPPPYHLEDFNMFEYVWIPRSPCHGQTMIYDEVIHHHPSPKSPPGDPVPMALVWNLINMNCLVVGLPLWRNMSSSIKGWWHKPNINGKIKHGNQTTNQIIFVEWQSPFMRTPQRWKTIWRIYTHICNIYVSRANFFGVSTHGSTPNSAWLTRARANHMMGMPHDSGNLALWTQLQSLPLPPHVLPIPQRRGTRPWQRYGLEWRRFWCKRRL